MIACPGVLSIGFENVSAIVKARKQTDRTDPAMILHNSHEAFYRQPMGPAPAGSQMTIRIRCDEATAVILRTWQDEERCYAMLNTGDNVWETAIQLPEKPGLSGNWTAVSHTLSPVLIMA